MVGQGPPYKRPIRHTEKQAGLSRFSLGFPPSWRETGRLEDRAARNTAGAPESILQSAPTRRHFLRVTLGSLLLPNLARADDASEVEAIAVKAGLGAFGRTETAHFLAIGDASSDYRAEALNASEKMAKDFLDDFALKGFADLAYPKRRMTVVILADAKSYAAYTGEKTNLAIGGHFELDTNRLVTFDFRGNQAQVGAAAERINSFILFHETSHQLTFNVGLLSLKADIPLCVSEGLATYGEVWRPNGHGRVGQVNKDRLEGIPSTARRLRESWLPLPRLIADDELLRVEKTQQMAYAQSWILIHSHLKNPEKRPRLRAYLAAINTRRDARSRLEDAKTHLGDLTKLDAEMRLYARRPIGQ